VATQERLVVRKNAKELDRLFIRNPWEKKLYRLGVPRAYWDSRLENVRFAKMSFRGDGFTAAQQRGWAMYLAKDVRLSEKIIVASSEPTDDGALTFAFSTFEDAINQKRNGAVLDSCQLENEKLPYFDPYPNYIVIYNLTDNSSSTRIQAVRDVCLRFKYSVKLIALGGVTNPEGWALTKLRLTPSLVFKLKDA
jgi:hypothetical protein